MLTLQLPVFPAMLTPDSLSLKSEPFSPQSNGGSQHHYPPSPSNSDHSSSTDGCNGNNSVPTRPLSPPYSPSNEQQAPKIQLVQTNGNGVAQMVVNKSSIVAVPDLSSLKIPIPKVTKPAPVVRAPPPQSGQPLVLTSTQLAQLTQGGLLKASVAQTTPSVVTTNVGGIAVPAIGKHQPIIIKTEPSIPCSNSPLTAGVPTVQSIPVASVNGTGSGDHEVSVGCGLSTFNIKLYSLFARSRL